MIHITNLGFPRIGRRRELKQALEAYWSGTSDAATLLESARDLRLCHWQLQAEAGVRSLPVGDFSVYDHVLDAALLFDALPDSHRALYEADPLRGYFALARGLQRDGFDLRALEMTKWFDTNYHHLVPELIAEQVFRLRPERLLQHWSEARALGIELRPQVLGPVSLLRLSKTLDGTDPLALLPRLLPLYADLFELLHHSGVDWLQLDEPCLALDLDPELQAAYAKAFDTLRASPGPRLLLTCGFGDPRPALPWIRRLAPAALHADLSAGLAPLPELVDGVGEGILVAGVVSGRSVWRSDLDALCAGLAPALRARGPERLWLAPSCSLLHLPISLDDERQLPAALRSWLSFAQEKLGELKLLGQALSAPEDAHAVLAPQRAALADRRVSSLVHRREVQQRVLALDVEQAVERAPLAERRRLQQQRLALPLLPTTTIGSFPQTREIRRLRVDLRAGRISPGEYAAQLAAATEACVREQESIGLDVLVHGEFERNDMVEYFGEQLAGFAFTRHAWVQSYGSRCVKPPILFGDVERLRPMTVDAAVTAQALSTKPLKGMLTGPVTMLQWSFVRDDQPREQTCLQLALALRDEVDDLQSAGIGIIQIDEPALREGLPLRRAERADYLRWAVQCFRLTAGVARSETQIHSHMCYSEFNDIIESVAAMDADVVSIEASRSRMELLDAFVQFRYPAALGPGVYDIHSPRVPHPVEMRELLQRALQVVPAQQLWVNPDCGLKTRDWPETRAALAAMVAVAAALRVDLERCETPVS